MIVGLGEEVVCSVAVSFILVFEILRVLNRLRWFNCWELWWARVGTLKVVVEILYSNFDCLECSRS